MSRLLSLDEPGARDPALTGVKASKLAQARAYGLPVLPGWVLSLEASRAAMRIGAEALERSGSAAAACLAVASADLDPELRHDLLRSVGAFGGPAVVRSSTPLDGDPRWAGTFSSYLDITEDLPTAVKGCWASMFTRDATERSEAIGVRPWSAGLAVLLQPHVVFELGGTATVDAAGTVRITAAPGGPAGILGGSRSGVAVEVDPDGRRRGDAAFLDDAVIQEVGSLVRTIRSTAEDDLIEWGLSSGGVFLLQVGRHAASNVSPPSRPAIAGAPPAALRLAVTAARFRGPLAEALLLPWAPALEWIPDPPPLKVADAAGALREARELAEALMCQSWGDLDASAQVESTFRDLLGSRPEAGFRRLSELRPVEVADAAHVVGLIEGAARRLWAEGRLPHPAAIWRCRAHAFESATSSSAAVPVVGGPDRWEPFVFGIVAGEGEDRTGTSAAPGIGAGPALVVRGPNEGRPEPRRVLVLPAPVPHVAPLLWECAAVVCARGSAGAHLFEVARSCGVPAIVGVDLRGMEADALVAVDGNTGRVTTWHPSELERAQRGA